MMNEEVSLEEFGVSQAMKNAGVSVPDAEEIKTGVPPWRKSSWCWPALCACSLGLAIVLGVAIGLSNSNGGADDGFFPSFTRKPGRNADLESVMAFLKKNDISDGKDLAKVQSPQFQAAVWLADADEANLAVPYKDKEIYHYTFRYVMALNYFALGGTDWSRRLNFLSDKDVCEWNGLLDDIASLNHLAPGVFCNRNTMLPESLHLRKFIDDRLIVDNEWLEAA
jgi:hypothetical protein